MLFPQKYPDFHAADIPEDRKVNVIALMREAYVDFSRYDIEGLDTSGYAFYHQLEEESYHGDLVTNIFAGGTVDSERCFLTGDYKVRNYRSNTNSYVWYLRQQGYTVDGPISEEYIVSPIDINNEEEHVTKIIIPILPFFIASTFCGLAYEGTITKQFPVFIKVIIIVMIGHYIWMALLYGVAGAYSGKNPIEVVKHYGPAYITAVGTMSSAATLAVALRCAKKSSVLRKDMVDFGIPLFANIHLCGSVLTEVFFVMTVSKILYGALPDMMTMVLFCVLLGVFAVGAPGVPGGTVMASLGLITGVLGFDATGTALMLTIFALQDSFGTACNVTGDGALTLMLTGYVERHGIKHQDLHVDL